MKIINDRKSMIFVSDYQGKELYSMGLSKKDMNGNYINGYISCRFKKDVHLKNKTAIQIKDAWLDFYLSNKRTIPYIFINEFDIVGEDTPIVVDEKIDIDPYQEIGDEIQLTDDDLPFDFDE